MKLLFILCLLATLACGKDQKRQSASASALSEEKIVAVERCELTECSDYCRRVRDNKAVSCNVQFHGNTSLLTRCNSEKEADYELCLSSKCTELCNSITQDPNEVQACMNSCR